MNELTDAQKKALELKKRRSVEIQKPVMQAASSTEENGGDDNKLILAKLTLIQKQLDGMALSSQNDPLNLGLMLICVPVVFAFLIHIAGVSMYFFGTTITSMIILVEAANAPNNRVANLSGIEWFVITSTFWFFTYPCYMVKRGKAGLDNLGLIGLAVSIGFTGSFVYKIGQFFTALGSGIRF